MRLLIIRPEPGASASAARAKAAGFEPLLLPFFEVRARDWHLGDPEKYDALLLTSANAVRHAGPKLDLFAAMPCYCVGQQTAAAAQNAGLSIAFVGGTDADEAVQAAILAGHNRLLWLAGEDHRPVIAPLGVQIDSTVVYASEALALTAHDEKVIKSAHAAALHSARAAQAFADSIDRFGLDRGDYIVAAFSPAIAAAAGQGWRDSIVATRPADSAMLSALAARSKDA